MRKKTNYINSYLTQNENSNTRSIANSTLLIFIPVLIFIIIATTSILVVSEKQEMKVIKNKEKSIVNSRLENIQNEILHVTNDLMIIAKNSQLEKLWDSNTNTGLIESVTEEFLNIAIYRKLYDQVRLINEDGKEIIRINFKNGNHAVVPLDKLQNKKDRYYFYDAFNLSKNEVFVSPLDLNIEHGEIEQPLKPMIRFATPVFDRNGKKRGIVLLNYFGQLIINKLISENDSLIESELMFVNENGYWLKGSTSEYEWGFMYDDKKDVTFKNTFANTWNRIEREESSQFITRQGLFTFKTIYPLIEGQKSSTGSAKAYLPSKEQLEADEYFWKIVSYIPLGKLYANRNMRRKYARLLIVFLSMGLFLISWKFAKAKYYRIKAQEELKESESYNKALFHRSHTPLVVMDMNTYEFIDCNEAAINIYGYKNKEEVLGKTPLEVSTQTQYNEELSSIAAKDKINNAIKNGFVLFEWRHQRPNGDIWDAEVHLMSLKYKGKKLLQFSLLDITDRKKAEQAQKESEEHLKVLNATKDKFFSIIAHDLKSPFNSMLGFSELLMKNFDKYDIASKKKFISTIYESIHKTYKLLENLLLWSRSQRGVMIFNPENENLYLLCNETIELSSQVAANKSISLKNEVSENLYVKADKNMLLTILRNLISNAIKFTDKGGKIILDANLRVGENKQKYAEISVSDNGVGITSELQSKLFKITDNVSTIGTNKEHGTGLGLILCKEFVEKHNGKIWVESEVGGLPAGKAGGGKFIFTIPIAG